MYVRLAATKHYGHCLVKLASSREQYYAAFSSPAALPVPGAIDFLRMSKEQVSMWPISQTKPKPDPVFYWDLAQFGEIFYCTVTPISS
ncbi:unnamed protein product, partial [Iphiclides podalirius]